MCGLEVRKKAGIPNYRRRPTTNKIEGSHRATRIDLGEVAVSVFKLINHFQQTASRTYADAVRALCGDGKEFTLKEGISPREYEIYLSVCVVVGSMLLIYFY